MEVISGKFVSSSLNPWAEPYVPGRYREVEDYSPEWWELVASSAGFRHYWLRDRFFDPQDHADVYEPAVLPDDDVDELFYTTHQEQEEHEEERMRERSKKGGEMVAWGMEKWWRSHGILEAPPKYAEKAPKIVNARVSPRTIQQPR